MRPGRWGRRQLNRGWRLRSVVGLCGGCRSHVHTITGSHVRCSSMQEDGVGVVRRAGVPALSTRCNTLTNGANIPLVQSPGSWWFLRPVCLGRHPLAAACTLHTTCCCKLVASGARPRVDGVWHVPFWQPRLESRIGQPGAVLILVEQACQWWSWSAVSTQRLWPIASMASQLPQRWLLQV